MVKEPKSLKVITKNTLWCLRLIFKSSPPLFIGIFVLQIFASTTPFIRNRVFSQVIDDLVYNSHQNWLTNFLIFIILLIVTSIFLYLQSQFSRVLDIHLQGYLRKIFIGKVSELDYQHLEAKDTGNLISKVDQEFGWRIRQTLSDTSNIFANIISLATVTIILLPKFPFLWLIIIISQVPQYFFEKHWIQKDWEIHENNSNKTKLMWDLNYQLRQKNYIAELRINHGLKYFYQKFCNIFDFFSVARINIRRRQTPLEFILIIISTSVNAFCLYTLITSTKSGLLTIGLFTFYFQSITQTSDFFRGLVYSIVSITENSYHIGNFKKVLSLENTVIGGSKKISSAYPAKIEFKNVSFKYPNSKNFIFKNLNITINPKEKIAIVGANGAGKSTLIKLICHFYEPSHGEILINGINLKNINLNNWYQQLSYLAQEFNHYYNLNLRENVSLGNIKNNNDQLIFNALKKADANFIKKYPHGLDTFMSQRYGGEEPSWGQAQKIAISRIFYRNSPITILDEPTASIDAISESKIFSRLYKNIKGKTLIIVSHRFSTVRNAERIIVLDKGQIVEQGTHNELIKKNGLYTKSFNLQAKGYLEV